MSGWVADPWLQRVVAAVPQEDFAGRFGIHRAFADIRRHENAAFIDAAIIIFGIVVADAVILEESGQAARGRTDAGPDGCRPGNGRAGDCAGRGERPNTRDRQSGNAENCPDAGASQRPTSGITNSIVIDDFASPIADRRAVLVASDDGKPAGVHTRAAQFADRRLGCRSIVENCRDDLFCHVNTPEARAPPATAKRAKGCRVPSG